MELKFKSLEDTELPEVVIKALVGAGLDTPEKVVEATDEDILAIAGISRARLGLIRSGVRTPLDRALITFKAMGEQYANTFSEEYPRTSKVLEMNGVRLTVGDFVELYLALR